MQILVKRASERYRKSANWDEINSCLQKDDEEIDHYYHRLNEVFDTNSGVTIPQGDIAGMAYEQQLKNACVPKRMLTSN